MATASAVLKQWREIQERQIEIAAECMAENKEPIIGLIIQQQQSEHVDSADVPLRPYSSRYRSEKIFLGRSGDTDFDLTGEFHGEMELWISGGEYAFVSPAQTDRGELKSERLQQWNEKGGSDAPIMTLTEENKAILAEIIRPSFIEKCNSDSIFD